MYLEKCYNCHKEAIIANVNVLFKLFWLKKKHVYATNALFAYVYINMYVKQLVDNAPQK